MLTTSFCSLTQEAPASFPAFVRLREICIDDGPILEISADETVLRATQAALDTLSTSLDRIAVLGDLVWGCSVRSLLALQELEIILPDNIGGLSLVLRHCTSLRSLSLFPLQLDTVFSAFEECPTALPGLRAFKVIYHEEAWLDCRHVDAYVRFLETKKKLRCLDMQISEIGQIHDDEHLLEPLAALPALEVLGLSFMRSVWRPGDIDFFEDCIPLKITALRVSVNLGQADNEVFQKEWFDLVSQLIA